MGVEYGRRVVGSSGIPVQVLAGGMGEAEWMPVGITLDWGLVAPAAADTTLPGGQPVKAGQKYLRLGQVVTRVTAQPVQTLTITATGGTYTLSGYRGDTGAYVQTTLPFNATAAAIAAALADPAIFGPTPIAVAGAGPYTITGPLAPLVADGTALTGAGAAATIAATTPVANSGDFGPYDPAATDGRQALTRGNCGILNESLFEFGPYNFGPFATNHPGVIVGGLVWRPRLLATAGAASLAAGPTFAALEAALPRLEYAAPTNI
jgi:hypothetical protein